MRLCTLVTGASGFIGAHLACGLAAQNHQVIAVGGASPPSTDVRARAKNIAQIDLAAETAAPLLAAHRPQVVVHAAALADTAACQRDPEYAHAVNGAGTANIVAACEALEAPPLLLYLSTDLVFDGQKAPNGGYREEDPAAPLSHYAVSKCAGEDAVRGYRGPGIVLRICLTYGPPIGGKQGFLGWMIRTLQEGRLLRLFSDEWRTPIHTADIEAVISAVIARTAFHERSNTLPETLPTLFHLGGAERLSRSEMGYAVAQALSVSPGLIEETTRAAVELPAPRAEDVSFNTELLRTTLGCRPRGFRFALKELPLAEFSL